MQNALKHLHQKLVRSWADIWQVSTATPGQILHQIKRWDNLRTISAVWLVVLFAMQVIVFTKLWLSTLMTWLHLQATLTSVVVLCATAGVVFTYRFFMTFYRQNVKFENTPLSRDDFIIELGLLPLAQSVNSVFSLMFWTGLNANLSQMAGLAVVTVGWVAFNAANWQIAFLETQKQKTLNEDIHDGFKKGDD